VSLDVAASNARAIRCYEKVGFETVGEIWRSAPDFAGVDLTSEQFAFVAPHVRYVGDAPQLRFLVMRSSRAQ
jgi:ribosomal protein S18 acetylase RimI-like enzyme